MIHVCFGIYDKDGRYSKFAGTSIASIFENTTSEVTVHILHDNTMTMGNFQNLVYLAGKYGQQIKFYNVEKICAEKIAELRKLMANTKDADVFTIGATYRLLLPQVISSEISKIIYLDTDIIANCDIKEFWQIDVEKFPLAAVTEISNGMNPKIGLPMCRDGFVKDEDYFNSGVLLINLNQMRTEDKNIMEGVKFRTEHTDYLHFDQDILNWCFSTKYLKVPNKFNSFVRNERKLKLPVDSKMYHYLGSSYGSGVTFNMRDPFNRLWLKYFEKTPWFNAEAIWHLYDAIRQFQHELQSRAVWLSKVMAGKHRAFFTPTSNVAALKKIFSVDDSEEIIESTDDESLKKLIKSMKKHHGRKLYFIVTSTFAQVREELKKAGFVEREDFVNGTVFASEINGVPMNSYSFIKAM